MDSVNAAIGRTARPLTATVAAHWPEYALEAVELGLFMVSASVFAVILFHPDAPAARAIGSEVLRRGLMGLAMGLTAVAIVYSPMGQRSGAHMNPAVTLAFWRLGKVEGWDAACYVLAQFAGAVAGMAATSALLGSYLRHPSIHHVSTVPGAAGVVAAWVAEFAIAFGLMAVVLVASNRASIARWTGLLAGAFVAVCILVEAPLSGMSMNPARTLGSSVAGRIWEGLWIYFTAPPLAMLAASELYRRFGRGRVRGVPYCAKLHHFNRCRCIFRCDFDRMLAEQASPGSPRAVWPSPHDLG